MKLRTRLLCSGVLGLAVLAGTALLGGSPEAAAQNQKKGEEKKTEAKKAEAKKAEPKKAEEKKAADPKPPAEERADDGQAKFQGAATCLSCHSQGMNFGIKQALENVNMNEYTIWKEQDKHSQAYAVLKGERGQQMAKLLGYDVTKDDRCLNCHTANVPKALREEAEEGKLFAIENGVSCDSCHGPSSKWLGDHINPATWRRMPLERKKAKGFVDVRNPDQRANLCQSCHVGNAEQNKVVTHDMYAAGHPVLPSFEIATFSHEMPRHWRYIREKKDAVQDTVYAKGYGIDPKEMEKTRLVVVGSAAALRGQMALLKGLANKGGEQWPDYAQFDCFACHHDLRTDSWRQKRGYTGLPGRPQMREWPTAILDIGLTNFSGPKNHKDALGELVKTFNRRPFGESSQVEKSGSTLATWTDGVIGDLAKTKFDAELAKKLLRRLATLPEGQTPDYDSARQIAWAFEIIYNELGEFGTKPESDTTIREALKALDTQLKLRLPSGTKRVIMEEYEGGLKQLNEYDPAAFRANLAKLAAGLPADWK